MYYKLLLVVDKTTFALGEKNNSLLKKDLVDTSNCNVKKSYCDHCRQYFDTLIKCVICLLAWLSRKMHKITLNSLSNMWSNEVSMQVKEAIARL